MNSVHLIGRVTAVPELNHTPGGKSVAEVNLAVDDGYGDNRKTYFFRLVFWEKKAEAAAQHLVRGQRIGVTGKLTQEKFKPKGSDKEETKTRVQVFEFDFLDKPQGSPAGGGNGGGSSAPTPREGPSTGAAAPSNTNWNSEEDEDDDIPF